jgi:hypothetical protein
MKSLKALALNKIHFADNTGALTRLSNLQLLSLKSSTITDNDLIGTRSSLYHAQGDESLTDMLTELARCENLQDLDISNCHRITFPGLMRYQELIECRHFDDHLLASTSQPHCCHSAPLTVVRTRECSGLKASGYSCVESRPIRGHFGQILYWEDYSPMDV